ncbi:hypothetical protein [Arthrobacter zhaoguopingii]|uniref:hypothetical protein n=1 Tax=Arthrobacter zhaoguopingii TaxID=2681491 RepID=UPI0013575079|nr:hypothetical protein [Arthrobacter zhaoguopingii]
MAGTDKSEEPPSRWVTAERWAAGTQDHGMGEEIRIYYTRYFPAGALLLLIVGTVGSYLLWGRQISWFEQLEFGVLLMATGSMIGGLVYNAKRLKLRVDLGRADVAIALNKTDQASVRRQIAGKEPPDQEHLTVVRAAAVQMRKRTGTFLLIMPSYLFLVGSQNLWWMVAGVAIIMLTGMFLIVRDFRRQGRFLQQTESLTEQNP